ncbi:MAG TPA: roadblock/LC7 domain-containing protein [Longimicrobiales bacterium]|nr:roadblock/LC7 domain-containing protein [Longimicrobiales bacterium]
MRSTDLPALISALREPTRSFVRESRVRIAILINGAGQVLATHGFTRAYEVMNVASLAAAAQSASRALATLTGAGRWEHLYHAGRERQLFLAPFTTPVEELILVAIFDAETSLGMVQLCYEQLACEIAALPELSVAPPGSDQASFERDLRSGLEFLAPEP